MPRDVDDILNDYLDLPRSQRPSFLERICVDDPDMRSQILDLAAALDGSDGFLDLPEWTGETPVSAIGKYEVLNTLGRGGMGVVYLANDSELQRKVAIKTLIRSRHGNVDMRSRLRDEALALAAVTQPNVAAIHSFEEEDGRSFITMEYVPGVTLSQRLAQERLSEEQALDFGRQISAALEAAHAGGVVHRDLKPDNIRIRPDGWVKVLDFGLAYSMRGSEQFEEAFQGTPGYMSPEQIAGTEFTSRSDLWSLGSVLYECFSGQPAIRGASFSKLIEMTAAEHIEFDPLAGFASESVVRLIRACLSDDPDDRPTSATEVRQQLEEDLLLLRSRSFRAIQGRTEIVKGNLPGSLSGFIGRESTLRGVGLLLREQRLVTLTGAGGSGKTRTALELVRPLHRAFPDGVWLIDLQPLREPTDMAVAILRILGVRDDKTLTPIENLCSHFAGQKLLLLVDNCEHLLDAAASTIGRILEACPGVTILATSREALAIPGEQVVALSPLDLPLAGDDPERIRESESIRLFETRARSRSRTFALSDTQLESAAEICRRLDGLPLGIELAAAQVRSLSVQEIRERLDDRFRFLVGRDRGIEERHRTLASLIEWSHQLLEDDEKRLFERLSVFRGGWTLAAAEVVCVDEELRSWRICDLLTRLVERSLVEIELPPPGSRRPTRYRFLETIRAFAETCWSGDDRDRFEGRYIAHFADWATPGPGDRFAGRSPWMDAIDGEGANLRHALELSIQTARVGPGVRLAVALGSYWDMRGLFEEGFRFGERLLELCATREGADPGELTRLWASMADLAGCLDNHDRAKECSTEALERGRRLGAPEVLVAVLTSVARAAVVRLDLDFARESLLETVELARAVNDEAALSSAIHSLGSVASLQLDFDLAKKYFEECLAIHQVRGNRLGVAKALISLGRHAGQQGNTDEAIEYLEGALEVHREEKDVAGETIVLTNLGSTYRVREEHEVARNYLLASMRLRHRIGMRAGLLANVLELGAIAHAVGRSEDGAFILGSVLENFNRHRFALHPRAKEMVLEWFEQIRSQIGELADQAWERGRLTDLEELRRFVDPEDGVDRNPPETGAV